MLATLFLELHVAEWYCVALAGAAERETDFSQVPNNFAGFCDAVHTSFE
jgi:hypothetical protein